MGDTWGDHGPPAEAYSRVTRDLDEVYGGLHDVARQLLDGLCRTHDVLRVPMRSWWVRDHLTRLAAPVDDLVAAWWLLPADPACLPGAVALVGRWDVRVRHTWFGDAAGGPVMCTCDACDDTLDEVSETLEVMLREMAGSHSESVRPHGVLRRSRLFSTSSRAEGGQSSSGSLVEPSDPMHARLPRRATLTWPSWPLRGAAGR